MTAMLVRIGVVALAGALGLLGSTLITQKSIAAIVTSDTTTPTTTSAPSTGGTTTVTSTAVSTATVQAPPTSPPVGVPVRNQLGRGCVTLGGVMLLVPGRRPLVLKPVADPAHRGASSGAFVYPGGAAVVRTDGVAVRVGSCRGRARASGRAHVRSPSLFEGAVTARAASLNLHQGRSQAVVEGVRIGERPVVLARGGRVAVAGWGYATTGERRELDPLGELQTALAVHLLKRFAGLPAGTIVAVGFSLTPKLEPAAARRTAAAHRQTRRAPHAQRQKREIARRHEQPKRRQVLGRRERWRRLLARLHHAHRPLRLRPPLGLPHYVFPVAGPASFGDSYGAARSDVAWHHGDDIFAPLGTPVVAVADGTLNRVGWERLGGWRLWVRDRLANEFYYAHLSGYTQTALRGRRVRAGQVLGFVGDTGDAFGTPPHLHFEIHPRSLLPLRYDGAVDPTTYLEHWQRLNHARGSRPLHPSLPRGTARAEALYVYRELLAARGLIRRAPPPPSFRPQPRTSRDFGSTRAPRQPVQKRPRETQKASVAPASTFMLEGIAVVFLAAPAALATTLFRRRGS
jgi:murein DD-endopeptidase MepM/ murein hydrolase activator NlpD